MRVAVCDDLKESLDQIEELLKQVPYIEKIDTFIDMGFFYDEIKDGKYYDVIFMDIDWKQEKTGIDFLKDIE